MADRPANPVDMPPSYFAARGQPMCSMWGKSEIECIALAYVQAMSNGGDTWKALTREQVWDLLTDDQKRRSYHSWFTSDFDVYQRWCEMVGRQLSNADGAVQVWRVSPATLLRLGGIRV